jgi:hypothetical protein
MHIDILYFEDCPHFPETLELVRDLADKLDVDADIETTEVETDRQARELEFRGSPSIRIDGEDIEPDVEDRTTVGRGCRVYDTPGGTSGVPPAEMIERALQNRRPDTES